MGYGEVAGSMRPALRKRNDVIDMPVTERDHASTEVAPDVLIHAGTAIDERHRPLVSDVDSELQRTMLRVPRARCRVKRPTTGPQIVSSLGWTSCIEERGLLFVLRYTPGHRLFADALPVQFALHVCPFAVAGTARKRGKPETQPPHNAHLSLPQSEGKAKRPVSEPLHSA